ncbi:MAG: class I SAM-dependent methyltransferase family protein [Candidatus Bathyarchaeota archaeon]|nr:class I SAM-dependent methyltransferase family protein [Candidatus Bathyarchaeota archaeon]
MSKTALCLKVPKNQGEKTIALVGKLGLLDKTLRIHREETTLCIPLIQQPKEIEYRELKNQVNELQITVSAFVEKMSPPKTVMQVLENHLPPHLLAVLPQALDVIGDIAIVEIPPELEPYQNLIGEAILKTHKNVKTVLAKASAITGTYRTREYIHIAGENKTRTIHREFGCQYYVDVAKAYFSPRLSHEHDRVASLVKSGETVVDLFAGVGPFSVLIGKKNQSVKVYAVDLNPDAVELLAMNVRVNRVDNRVFPMLGDARQFAATKLKGLADRVIMNLPEKALDFTDAACQTIKPQGGSVHFYAFIRSPDSIDSLKERCSDAVEQNSRKIITFQYEKSIRETAPYESQVVLDAVIK